MKTNTRIPAFVLAVLMLFALLPRVSFPAQAVVNQYDLYICGVQVTDSNKDDILGDGGFRYDPSRNELVLQYSKICQSGTIPVDNRIQSLTFWMAGNLYAQDAECVIKSSTDLTIKTGQSGAGINGQGSASGISITNDSTLTIEDASLNFMNCSAYAISGRSDGEEKLVIRNSGLKVEDDTIAVSCFIGGIELEYCEVTPETDYMIANGCIAGADGNPLTGLAIQSTLSETYSVFVDGIRINSLNKDDVFMDGGSVKYDPQTNTLTFDNPEFSGRFGWILASYADGLTIRGKASYTGAASEKELFTLYGTSFNGDFSFTNTEGVCIIHLNSYLKFAGGTINLKGANTAIVSQGPVEFSGGDVTITALPPEGSAAEKLKAFYSGEEIKLSGTEILTPKNGKIGGYTNHWYIVDADGNSASSVRIAVPIKFEDVREDDDCYDAVLWAANHKPYQVTAGIDKTHFGPDRTVTRAQAMTFFWAAKDRPKFKKASTQFVDVKKTDWYYKAVMWAVEKKITAGTDATHFSPNKTCNRGEILTFLYAALKKPKVSISNPYKDVSDQWYRKAALWAWANGIEKGENGKFNASTPCTRASTVSYLYRFFTGLDLDK